MITNIKCKENKCVSEDQYCDMRTNDRTADEYAYSYQTRKLICTETVY